MTEFLEGLEGKLSKQGVRAWRLLDLVASEGPPRNTAISHSLSREIWEFLPADLRILWFYDENRVIVCSHAFVKKSRKTPKAEIERAEAVRLRYLEAKRRAELVVEEIDP